MHIENHSIHRAPFYFGDKAAPLLGWLHTDEKAIQQDHCVLICSPVGLEYMNSYRSLRHIADYYARAGIPALRFDYQGTGDSSGSNYDDKRIDSWLESIRLAFKEIQRITKRPKVGIFGFRLGATLAAITSNTQTFDFITLWAPIEKGNKFIREIKALQKMSANPVENKTILLEAGGMFFSLDTEVQLKKINLFDSKPLAKNVLIIPRDNLSTNTKLQDHLQQLGLNVEQLELSGSSDMLVDAHLTNVPHKSIEHIVQWSLKYTSNFNSNDIPIPELNKFSSFVHIDNALKTIKLEDNNLIESFFYFNEKSNNHIKDQNAKETNTRFGIQSESTSGFNDKLPIIILANSGANHRVGPSRLYVQLARQLAIRGFLVYRIDLPGIGDSIVISNENNEYIDTGAKEILDSINEIKKTHSTAAFIIAGLCSGAYFSFHTALSSPNKDITEILMINPLTFYWENGMTAESSPTRNFSAWNWYKKALSSSDSWKKLLGGKVNYRFLLTTLFLRLKLKLSIIYASVKDGFSRKQPSKSNENKLIVQKTGCLGTDLENISSKGTMLSFLFSRSDPGYDLLKTLGSGKVNRLLKEKKINIQFVENADHTFSKLGAREDAINKIVSHLDRTYCNKT